MRDYINNLLSYFLLALIIALFFPVPKLYLGVGLGVVYTAWFVLDAFNKPVAALSFLFIIGVPLLAFVTPGFLPTDMPPLIKLGISVFLWGILISFCISLVLFIFSRKELTGEEGVASPDIGN